MYMDKEQLFTSGVPEADVEIPGKGTVRVRGLTRAEVLKATGGGGDIAVIERRLLAAGMVSPTLTENDARRWQERSLAYELQPVTEAIERLSGMDKGAAKEAYLEFEQDSDAEFRVLPGEGAGDDGGPAEG